MAAPPTLTITSATPTGTPVSGMPAFSTGPLASTSLTSFRAPSATTDALSGDPKRRRSLNISLTLDATPTSSTAGPLASAPNTNALSISTTAPTSSSTLSTLSNPTATTFLNNTPASSLFSSNTTSTTNPSSSLFSSNATTTTNPSSSLFSSKATTTTNLSLSLFSSNAAGTSTLTANVVGTRRPSMFGGLTVASTTSSAFNPALSALATNNATSGRRYTTEEVANQQHPLGRPAWIQTLLARKSELGPVPRSDAGSTSTTPPVKKKTAGSVTGIRRLGRRLYLLSHGPLFKPVVSVGQDTSTGASKSWFTRLAISKSKSKKP